MRILFVTSRFPYPLSHGDRVRGYHHLRILSRQHQIILVTPQSNAISPSNLEAIRPFCERVEVVPAPFWRSALRLARAPLSSLPLQTLYFYIPALRKKVQELLVNEMFDLVHVQLVRMGPVVDGLPADVPKVLDFIDALSVNMTRRASRERPPLSWIVSLEAKRLQQYERSLVHRFDQSVVSSPMDCSAIGAFDNLHVVSNGVNLEEHPFIVERPSTKTIVFFGSMWYFPNIDASTWFVKNVFPLVRQQEPDAELSIVGARPASAVTNLGQVPGVYVTGYIPSVQEYLARAAVAIAPMQGGSGMQFKVIEAMASGTPVVATPQALGGLEANHDEHLLVAKDAEDFAAHVVRLFNDPELQRRLAQNARKLVENKYSWEKTVAMLEDVYRLAISMPDPMHRIRNTLDDTQ